VGEGAYRCVIIAKEPHENRSAVCKVGLALLKLRNDEAAKGVGAIVFQGVPRARSHEAFLDIINGEKSWPAHVRFARSEYTREEVVTILRRHFPPGLVQDVTVDGQSIYGAKTD
jgi:hypothetical protein